MKNLILHVGLHKTATSSIQATCSKNRDILNKQGICYPIFELGNRKIVNHSIPLFSLFSSNPSKYHMNICWKANNDIPRINSIYSKQLNHFLQYQNVLLSGESISHFPPKSLMKLKSFFEAKGFKINALCSIPAPYSYMCSFIQQRIKEGRLHLNSLDVPANSKIIKKLQDVFKEDILFYSFEQDCNHRSGPVEAFFERIGIDYNDLEMVYNKNKGIGNLTARLYACINETFPILLDGKLNPKRDPAKIWRFDNEKFLLSETELNSVRNALDQENHDLATLIGDAFTDKDYKTSQPITITKEMALDIYQRAVNPAHLSKVVLNFIQDHCNFPIYEMAELHPGNPNLLRDIALIMENTNLNKSYELMTLAHKIKPNGPFIEKKVKEYTEKLKKVPRHHHPITAKSKKAVHHLYLHLGFGKTGSSAIQSWLANNSDLLAQKGFSYLINENKSLHYEISSGNGENLLQFLLGKSNEKFLLKHYFSHGFPNTIISSESLVTGIQSMNRLNEFCETYGIELTVIAYLRNPVDFFYSRYVQRVKRHNLLLNYIDFLKTQPFFHLHLKYAEEIYRIFDNVIFIHYNEHNKNIFKPFCDILDLDESKFKEKSIKVNRTLSFSEITILQMFVGWRQKYFNDLNHSKISGLISDWLVNTFPNRKSEIQINKKIIDIISKKCRTQVNNFNKTIGKKYNIQIAINDSTNFDGLVFDTHDTAIDISILQDVAAFLSQKKAFIEDGSLAAFAKELYHIDPEAHKILLNNQ